MDQDIEKSVEDEIVSLIYEGKKIQAIKVHRKATFQGLKESKDYVDKLTLDLYEKNPGRFAKDPTRASGCGTAVFILGFAGLALWFLV
jgi:hypothetical protein